jgi:hypothetical protein
MDTISITVKVTEPDGSYSTKTIANYSLEVSVEDAYQEFSQRMLTAEQEVSNRLATVQRERRRAVAEKAREEAQDAY